MLFTLASAAASLLVLEWPVYARLLSPADVPLGTIDHVLLAWTIWSKSIVFLTPSLIIALILLRTGRLRTAWWCHALSSVTVYTLIGLDLLIYGSYGHHLWTLAGFIDQPEATAFVGGLTRWLWMPAVCLAVASAGTACLVLLARRCAPLIHRAAPRSLTTAAMIGIAVLAPLALKNYTRRAVLFERASAVFPVDLRPASSLYAPLAFDDPVLESLDRGLRQVYREAFPRLTQPSPPDPAAIFHGRGKPNVILIVLESLNFEEAVVNGGMPKVAAWGKQGMALNRHYSGSNHTEAGLFTLLYSRPAWVFHSTLDARMPPQLCETFRKSGYETGYFSAVNSAWLRLDEFVNRQTFDRYEFDALRDGTSAHEWIEWDKRALRSLATAATEARDKPLMALCFLNSSHLPYPCPDEYKKLLLDGREYERAGPPIDHYRRALRFLDDEIAAFLASVDPARNIVVVTGDHGESIGHDGTHGHYTSLSDAQTRVPMFIVGPGVPRLALSTATTHADILPTLLQILAGRPIPIAGSAGRDLLAGPPADEALLCSVKRDGRLSLLAIRGGHRLAFDADSNSPNLKVLGFQDAIGRRTLMHEQAAQDVEAWARLIGGQIGPRRTLQQR